VHAGSVERFELTVEIRLDTTLLNQMVALRAGSDRRYQNRPDADVERTVRAGWARNVVERRANYSQLTADKTLGRLQAVTTGVSGDGRKRA
jgi:hypothetical protein